MTLDRGSRPLIAPDVVSAEVDGDTILLDGRSGAYYAMNPVGTRAWTLITGGAALGDVHDALLAEYDVSADVLWADLTRLVAELQDNGLVKVESRD